MSSSRWSARLLVFVALTFPLRAKAQVARPLSLDATAGPGYVVGGPEVLTRGSMVADGLLTIRLRNAERGGWLAGLSASFQGPPPSGDKCVPGNDGQCLHDYPQFSSVSVLTGWTNASGRVRMLGGLASVRATHDDPAAKADYTLGVPLRGEFVLAQFSHVAFVASLRATVLPRYRGSAYTLLASGVGVRLFR